MGTTEKPAWLRMLARGREDDPRVAHDLELLAATYGPDPAPPPDRATVRAQDLELLAATYGATAVDHVDAVASGVDVVTHVRRYRVPYGVAALVLAVVLLADPVSGPGGGFAAAGTFGSAPAGVESSGAAPDLLPSLESPVFGVPGEYLSSPALADLPEIALPVITAPTADSGTDDATPLRIVASGYASVFGGTPLEQPPPEEGLPVSAAAGSATKTSFVRLSGTEAVLRLEPVAASGANVNETGGAVKACPITGPWQPARGMAMADAPAYNGANCALANVVDGVWTFDLVAILGAGRTNGFALIPGPAVSDTFQVTFKPSAA